MYAYQAESGPTFNDELVLLSGVLAGDAGVHPNLPHKLLAQEVPHLHQGVVLRDGAVDGEMSIHSTHLVLVTLKLNQLGLQ